MAIGVFIVFLFTVESQKYDQVEKILERPVSVTAAGTVNAREVRDTSVLYRLKSVTFYLYGSRVHVRSILVYSQTEDIPLGSRVISSGVLSAFSPSSNQGSFDAASYYRSLQIQAQQRCENLELIKKPFIPWQEGLQQLREAMRRTLEETLSARDAGILSAMTLGDKTLMETEVRQQYQNMGISHILAISGLHISLVGMSTYRLLRRRLQLSYLVSCTAAGLLVFFFAVMSGFSVSTQRAVVMFAFYLGAEYWGRTYTFPLSMLYSAALILLINPLAVFQTGFLLSYCAVASIFTILPVLDKLFPSFKEQIFTEKKPSRNRYLRDGFLKRLQSYYGSFRLSFSIWFAMLPITAYFFYQVPLFSVLLNMIVLPLCGPLLGFSILGSLIGCLPSLPVLKIFSSGMLWFCHLILAVFDSQMSLFGGIRGACHITGRPDLWLVILFYAFLFGGVLFYTYSESLFRYLNYYRYHVLPELVAAALFHVRNLTGILSRMQKIHRKKTAAVFLLLPSVLCAVILTGHASRTFSVDMLDVGQGDGICISSSAGIHVFIDGGSTSADHVGIYRILPFLRYRCIRRIDFWLISHTDEDHVNGIIEVLESGYPVDCLVFSQNTPEDANKRKLLRAAARYHTAVRTVKAGDEIRCPDLKMRCLYPAGTDISEDTNALSQIWRLETDGLSMLFTGDLGSKEEKTLISRGLLEQTDVLKVAHHGSKNSSCEEFLKAIQPSAALISVGKHNTYGHPSRETLDRLAACRAQYFATMDYGQLEVILKDSGYQIRVPMRSP